MKKINFLILLTSTVLLGIFSCKKAENKLFFEGGTNPVLSASSNGPLVLLPSNSASNAITFRWTNPEYKFNTGVSSQNVSNILQVALAGQNFANAREFSMGTDLSKIYTVKDFNTVLMGMDLEGGTKYDVEFRLKTSLGNAVPLFSNILKMAITPYLDVVVPIPPTGELYITGSAVASGWTNSPPTTQKFTKVSVSEYTITIALTGGNQIKFLSTQGQWQPQYGMVKDQPGILGANMGSGSDPEAINIDATGTYKVTVNFKTGKYTVVKQ